MEVHFAHACSTFQHRKQHLSSRSQIQIQQSKNWANQSAHCIIWPIKYWALKEKDEPTVFCTFLLLELPYWLYVPSILSIKGAYCAPIQGYTYWNIHSFMNISFVALRETFLHLLSWNQDEASGKPLLRPGACSILKRMLWHKQWSAKVVTYYGPLGVLAICLLIIYTTAWLLHRKQILLLVVSSCHIITVTGTGRIPGKLCLFLPITVATFGMFPI